MSSQAKVMTLKLKGNASPEQVALFNHFTQQSPTAAMDFLWRLAKESKWRMNVTLTNEERIEASVLSQLQEDKIQMDELIRETGFPTHMVSAQLMMMELSGTVKKLPGGFYMLTNPHQSLPPKKQAAAIQQEQLKPIAPKTLKSPSSPKKSTNNPYGINEMIRDCRAIVDTWLSEGNSLSELSARKIMDILRDDNPTVNEVAARWFANEVKTAKQQFLTDLPGVKQMLFECQSVITHWLAEDKPLRELSGRKIAAQVREKNTSINEGAARWVAGELLKNYQSPMPSTNEDESI